MYHQNVFSWSDKEDVDMSLFIEKLKSTGIDYYDFGHNGYECGRVIISENFIHVFEPSNDKYRFEYIIAFLSEEFEEKFNNDPKYACECLHMSLFEIEKLLKILPDHKIWSNKHEDITNILLNIVRQIEDESYSKAIGFLLNSNLDSTLTIFDK